MQCKNKGKNCTNYQLFGFPEQLRKYTQPAKKVYLAIVKYIFSTTKINFSRKDYKYRGNYMDDDDKSLSGLLEEEDQKWAAEKRKESEIK